MAFLIQSLIHQHILRVAKAKSHERKLKLEGLSGIK